MQDGLTRFITERTRMLEGLSHDLRQPLTAMRLRVDVLDEDEDSVRLQALVVELQAMVEATLNFARCASVQEAAVQVDLAAVLADLVSNGAAGEGHAIGCSPARAGSRLSHHAETRAAQPDRQCDWLWRRSPDDADQAAGTGHNHHC